MNYLEFIFNENDFQVEKEYKLKFVSTFVLLSLNQPFNQYSYLLCRHCLLFKFFTKLTKLHNNMVVFFNNIHFL